MSRLARRFTETPLLLAAARLSFRAKSLLDVTRIEPAGSGARWTKPAGRAMGIANQTSLSVTTVNRLYFGDNLGWLRNTKEFPDASPPPAIPAFLSNIAGMSRVIEIRPFRGGWQCFEAEGVAPYWRGERAKQDAIGYATARAKFGRCEICVLNDAGQVTETIQFDGERRT